MKQTLKKYRLFIGLAIVMLLAAGVVFVFFTDRASSEMKFLRQIETKLALPRADSRTEMDKGSYKDSKGALQNDRHITMFYKENDSLSSVMGKLTQTDSQWVESPLEEQGQYVLIRRFINYDQKVCLSYSTDSASTDKYPFNVTLSAASEHSCAAYFD